MTTLPSDCTPTPRAVSAAPVAGAVNGGGAAFTVAMPSLLNDVSKAPVAVIFATDIALSVPPALLNPTANTPVPARSGVTPRKRSCAAADIGLTVTPPRPKGKSSPPAACALLVPAPSVSAAPSSTVVVRLIVCSPVPSQPCGMAT